MDSMSSLLESALDKAVDWLGWDESDDESTSALVPCECPDEAVSPIPEVIPEEPDTELHNRTARRERGARPTTPRRGRRRTGRPRRSLFDRLRGGPYPEITEKAIAQVTEPMSQAAAQWAARFQQAQRGMTDPANQAHANMIDTIEKASAHSSGPLGPAVMDVYQRLAANLTMRVT